MNVAPDSEEERAMAEIWVTVSAELQLVIAMLAYGHEVRGEHEILDLEYVGKDGRFHVARDEMGGLGFAFEGEPSQEAFEAVAGRLAGRLVRVVAPAEEVWRTIMETPEIPVAQYMTEALVGFNLAPALEVRRAAILAYLAAPEGAVVSDYVNVNSGGVFLEGA
jgi:hypothetical protein